MPRYKIKEGYGTHRVLTPGTRNKKFKDYKFGTENEIIECEEWELAGARDKFERLDDKPSAAPTKAKDILRIVHKGSGKYNVLNILTGKVLNDELLTKKAAEDLLDQLVGEDKDEKRAVGDSKDVAAVNSGDSRRRPKPSDVKS